MQCASAQYRLRSTLSTALRLSHLRPTKPLCLPASRRNFTLGTLLSPSVYDTPRLLMEHAHTYGLEWAYVVPVLALAVRAILLYPVTIPTRRALQRRTMLSPLISSRKGVLLQTARNDVRAGKAEGPVDVEFKRSMKGLVNELQARFRCGKLRTMVLPMLQFPLFLWASSTIRDMIGMPSNMIMTFLGMGGSAGDTSTAFQESMMNEGPRFAVDLTLADPTGSLSYIVSAIMIAQTLSAAPKQQGAGNSFSKAPTFILIALSASIGPVLASAPAGLLWYWAWSSGLALGVNRLLDRRYPLTYVKPCKRPVNNN